MPRWEGRPFVSIGNGVAGAIVMAVVVWLLYLAVKLAQHVSAWPF